MTQARDPREIALEAHRNYYEDGAYDTDRLRWTIEEFLPSGNSGKVLEVGCGNGTLLQLLTERGLEAVGVDASLSGIERCVATGVQAHCLDVSTEGLPFANDFFDLVFSLETFEHLMNPHYALQEVRRVLKPGSRFICSIPNPLTGHPYLYPGLFHYKNFRLFLEQSGFEIKRVAPWQWAPRETILPPALRGIPVLNGRIIAGGVRRIIEKAYRVAGVFPWFCYWLWTFECCNNKARNADAYREVSIQTRPGSDRHFSVPK
jgi:SAM-dependent methyltransferase